MSWKALNLVEGLFVGKHTAAICVEAAYTGAVIAAHDWDVLACAMFQTVAYFCDGTMYFKDWRVLAGLGPSAQWTLMELMRCRGWKTQSQAVPFS
jgi:hypothetical protein